MTDRRRLYTEGEDVRAVFGGDADAALAYVKRYVDFVARFAPPAARILDAGCGGGWSTLALRELGHDAQGLDLHAGALEVDVPYTQADVTSLPFPDESFDVVAMHQVLEHVDEPELALAECRRVLKPGGRLVVVGPNLASPAVAARALLVGLLSGPRRRTPGMPRHPYGNVPREWLAALARTLSRRPRFERRVADTNPPFHADNDASWFCNPADIRAWGRAAGMRPVCWWSDRLGARVWWPLAAGTWIVLEKNRAGPGGELLA